MSQSLLKQLVSYRTWIAAVINAAITWIILIIAPLGLFAVITCTLSVFFSSLLVGWVCDKALLQILSRERREAMEARWESENIDLGYADSLDLHAQHHKKEHRQGNSQKNNQ